MLAVGGTLLLTGGVLLLFSGWIKAVGLAIVAVGGAITTITLREMIRPRLSCDGTYLLAYVGGWQPARVPLEIVEVFFLGQGPSKLPQPVGRPLVNSTVVVRLAEAAKEWHKRDTNTRVAHWCEGYITLRGVWCEPLNTDTIRRLNSTLVETKRGLKSTGASH